MTTTIIDRPDFKLTVSRSEHRGIVTVNIDSVWPTIRNPFPHRVAQFNLPQQDIEKLAAAIKGE